MTLFLNDDERAFIQRERIGGVAEPVFSAMRSRVTRRAESPGLVSRTDTVDWWHVAEEAVCDAALVHAIEPMPRLGAWLRSAVVSIVDRPVSDWVGPWFRDHSKSPPMASLETAHLLRAVAVALDLSPDVFTPDETQRAREFLRHTAMPMAVEFLKHEKEVHNYWAVVTSGLAVAGAVLDDRPAMDRAAAAFEFYTNAFQPDGTYAESLQYANYTAMAMMLTYEALTRRDAAYARRLNPCVWAGVALWSAYAHLYCKPLHNCGQEPIPRSINFGDSSAIFVPSADLLLHIASRCAERDPTNAAVARWLFDTAIAAVPSVPPFDRASFGFVNRPGFLSLPLLTHAIEGKSPQSLTLPAIQSFSSGDVIARDAWDGKTVLAVRTGGDAMNVVSHVHGDMNSLQLVHNRERLLVDPGHSCYRNLIHDLEGSSVTHNTCTFKIPNEPAERVQRGIANRRRAGDGMEPPIAPLTRLHLVSADGDLRVIVSDAAGRYGAPIESFVRVVILCGSHALFVADRIRSSTPVLTRWNWLLNNRDQRGDLDMTSPGRIAFGRGDAGMRLFIGKGLSRGGPRYAYVHDAYHTYPNQLGEGAAGSGLLVHTQETHAATDRLTMHAIAMDDRARVSGWECEFASPHEVTLRGSSGAMAWALRSDASASRFEIADLAAGRSWSLNPHSDGDWSLHEVRR